MAAILILSNRNHFCYQWSTVSSRS